MKLLVLVLLEVFFWEIIMGKRMHLDGRRFGRLIVLYENKPHVSIKGREYRVMTCKCDCGNIKEIFMSNLTGENTLSCGCIHREVTRIHGLAKHPLYYVWHCMIKRCYNLKHHQYHRYGARGIKVCKEWRNNFKAFYDWCMSNGYEKGLQIDRFPDNDGNYEHSNCRFTTGRKNVLNARLLYSNNKSGYRGVCWMNGDCMWRAYIKIKNKLIILGLHNTKELAVKARNDYIIENNLEHEYQIQPIKHL